METERKWTEAQKRAITARGKSLLVSAAAGSGKTATLTERIIGRIRDGGDISRMLVVTFTKAAAGELKERISRALNSASSDSRGLKRQLLKLENAKICTIHAFCLDILRSNFAAVGLPAVFRTLDEAEVKILRRRVMDELVTDCYDSGWEKIAPESGIPFPEFADAFRTGRDEGSLIDLFLEVYESLASYRDGLDCFGKTAEGLMAVTEENFLSESQYGRLILDRTLELCRHYRQVFECVKCEIEPDSKQAVYLSNMEEELSGLEFIESSAKDYRTLREAVNAFSQSRLATLRKEFQTEATENYKALRAELKDDISALKARFFSSPSDVLLSDCKKTAEICSSGGAFIREFSARYSAAKRRMAAIDYTDMEHMTLGLLTKQDGSKSDIALSVGNLYDEIYIDEYQDVNDVQDRIFRAISNGDNRFMVGDIKQSIYGFRGAMPDIFADYRRRYSGGEVSGEVIFMSENFRSDRPILSFANSVFDSLFSAAGRSVDYRTEDRLLCGKSESGSLPVNILLTERPVSDDETDTGIKAATEAETVAKEIKRLLSGELKNDGTPILPSDIAVILRSAKGQAPIFASALRAEGIPCFGDSEEDFFENPEVLLVLSLLCAIDNPHRDVYLLGLMLSPLCGFTLDEIVNIRLSEGTDMPIFDALRSYNEKNDFPKLRRFLCELAKYREMSEGTPCDAFLRRLYRECRIMSAVGGGAKSKNLIALLDAAESFESHGFKGLYAFILYLQNLIELKAPLSDVKSPGDGSGVRIMTVHASKGLEYPVCFVSGCGKRQNDSDSRRNLLFEYRTGFGMKLRVGEHSARAETALRGAVSAVISEKTREEELRVLYVALTRARERLYVTATVKDAGDSLSKAKLSALLLDGCEVRKSSTFIDLILSALQKNPCPDCRISVSGGISDCGTSAAQIPEITEESGISEEAVERYKAELSLRLGWKYHSAELASLPAKVSVSKLYPGFLDDEAGAELGTSDERAAFTLVSAPSFMSGETGLSPAAAGTATHVFLQFCDYGALLGGDTEAELARLTERKFMTAAMAKAVRLDEIEKFARSPLFSEISAAKRVWREHRFNLRLPAADFTEDEAKKEALAGEFLLVQGVTDCFFEDEAGKITLVDYKTDRLPRDGSAREILLSRHGEQLYYYRCALESIFGEPPARVAVYSLCLGEAFYFTADELRAQT